MVAYDDGRDYSEPCRTFDWAETYGNLSKATLTFVLDKFTSSLSLRVLGGTEYMSDIIFKHLKRFSILSLAEVPPKMVFRMLNLPSETYANLERLSLKIKHTKQHIPEIDFSALQNAPKLRSVTYEFQEISYIRPLFLLPWSQLEEIRMNTMALPPSTIYDIWRCSPSLTSCSFVISETDTISTSPIITLLSLTSLELRAYECDWGCFLNPVITPCLEILDISGSQVPCPQLTSLIIRSHCSIKGLRVFEEEVNEGEIDDDTIQVLFNYLLEVVNFDVSWSIPASAIRKIHDGALPKLVNAMFMMYPEAFDVFLDMLDSHMDHPRQNFRLFDVGCYPGPGYSEVRKRYRARYEVYEKAEGLSVSVISESAGLMLQDDGYSSAESESSNEEFYDE